MNLQLGRAIGLIMKTSPYIMYRAMIYGAMCAAVAFWLLILAGIGYVFGGGAAMLLFFISMVGGGFGFRLLREYVLYMLQAGHIALVTELVTEGDLPSGISQTAWAKERVTTYFKEVSALALVDQLVKGIIRALNRTLFRVTSIIPIPGVEGLTKVAQRIVDFSLTYVDESIIAYTFKTKNENVFDAAKTGVVLYCQSWKPLLTNAVALTLLSYVFVIVCAIIFMIPLGIVALLLPSSWAMAKFALFVLALFMGISLKWILFDPIACTSTMLVFLEEAEKQVPNPEWEEKIEQVSGKFNELKQKAAERFKEMEAKAKPSETPPEPEAGATEA